VVVEDGAKSGQDPESGERRHTAGCKHPDGRKFVGAAVGGLDGWKHAGAVAGPHLKDLTQKRPWSIHAARERHRRGAGNAINENLGGISPDVDRESRRIYEFGAKALVLGGVKKGLMVSEETVLVAEDQKFGGHGLYNRIGDHRIPALCSGVDRAAAVVFALRADVARATLKHRSGEPPSLSMRRENLQV
jgi:hypothetical protein